MFKSPVSILRDLQEESIKLGDEANTENINSDTNISDPIVEANSVEEIDFNVIAEDLDAVWNYYREIQKDSTKAFKEENIQVFKAREAINNREYQSVKKDLDETRNLISEKIQAEPLVMDISKNSLLKRYMVDVFGKQKTSIDGSDYLKLIKLKEELELNEQEEISELT